NFESFIINLLLINKASLLYLIKLKIMNLLFLNLGGMEIILLLIPSILFLYSFYKLIVDKHLTTNERLFWVIIFLIFNVLGAIAYWVWGNNKKSTIPS